MAWHVIGECRERYRPCKAPMAYTPVLQLPAAAPALPSAVAFATFKDLLLFGYGEHPQLVQLEYFYKAFN